MRRILPRSLEGLLLLNESALLALVLVTATLTGLWAWFWTESSREAARIETLARLAERVRGDMYRQLQEVVHARLTENPAALRVYAGYRRQIAQRFTELHGLVRDESERAAVEYLQDAYTVVLEDMEKVFVDPNEISELARMKLLDPAYEEWMLSELESALRVIETIVERRRQGLDATRSGWTRWTPIVVPLSVALAVALLLLSRRSLRRRFVDPLRSLVDGAIEVSRGNLAHRIPPEGAEEVRRLAATFGEMTRKLAESQRVLVESERQAALGALVPVVAHNIRNPLASIRATAQIMDDAGGGAELAESRRVIIDTVDRLERWVTALLSYLVPLEPRRRECRLGDVVAGALGPLAPKLERKALRVVREGWERDAPLAVDPDLLEQAIHALVGNAVEASPAHATIRLELARSADALELRIDDEGRASPSSPTRASSRPAPAPRRGATGSAFPWRGRSAMRTAARSTSGAGAGAGPARPFPCRSRRPVPGREGPQRMHRPPLRYAPVTFHAADRAGPGRLTRPGGGLGIPASAGMTVLALARHSRGGKWGAGMAEVGRWDGGGGEGAHKGRPYGESRRDSRFRGNDGGNLASIPRRGVPCGRPLPLRHPSAPLRHPSAPLPSFPPPHRHSRESKGGGNGGRGAGG